VTELRAAALAAKPGVDAGRFDAERALGASLKQLLVLQEAYPQLKADANFRDLSAKLVDVEDQLQYARRFYNGAVKQYRDRLESFPHVLVARAFGFAPLPFFETDDRAAVQGAAVRRLAFLLALFVSVAAAEEKVLSFHSDIRIAADGWLTVTETIDINVEGNQIKRGILRDFPTDYRDRFGRKVSVPFHVIAVRATAATSVTHGAQGERRKRAHRRPGALLALAATSTKSPIARASRSAFSRPTTSSTGT
jgi:hypothetical protein